jgi:ATP-dependent helicase/nuclease subunit A
MLLADSEARLAAATDLHTTFLVEAGAGTGKTTVLVNRFVACLLDEEGTPIERVVAITFTDKAAGELRQRVRQRLEELLADPARRDDQFGVLDGARRERLQVALATLERAPISTIHAFAARLLRERPVEAGIDPAFAQLDALGSELLLDHLWEEWLDSLLDMGPDEPTPDAALLAGVLAAEVRLSTLRTLAMNLAAQRYHVEEPAGTEPPDLATEIAVLQAQRQRLASVAGRCSAPDDRLLTALHDLDDVLLALPVEGSLHELGAALVAAAGRKYGAKGAGSKGNWGGAAGKEAALAIRDEAVAQLAAAAALYQAHVAALALAVAGRFVRFAAGRQATLGQLDFDDLLGKARDLLLQQAPRRFFQEQFRYVLVDEFQDTDPLQAEIVFLLAAREPAAQRWQANDLVPGKLFMVGDAKQSI